VAGNSKKSIRDFPEGAQKLLGDELQLIQFGGVPGDAKPFKGVGSGVIEGKGKLKLAAAFRGQHAVVA
jgi:phage-related protein